MSDNQIIVLSSKEINQLVPIGEAIDWMADAFTHLSQGKVNVPLRTRLELPENAANMLIMPVASPDIPVIVIKAVSIFSKNAARCLPLIHSLIQVFDAEDGKPVAILDGEYLTALRTGAACGLATRLLARKEARTAAVFGTGVQGQIQLKAIAKVRPLNRVYLFNRSGKNLREISERLSHETGVEVLPGSRATRLEKVDIICTATTSRKPLFRDTDLKTGVHINSIGAYKPGLREIPLETLHRARIFVGSRKPCLTEDGDLTCARQANRFSEKNIVAEIGDIAAGNCEGRTSESQVTLFKSVGNAAQDLWAVHKILEKAKKSNIGQRISI